MTWIVLFMDGDILRNIVLLGLYSAMVFFEYKSLVEYYCNL